MRKITKMMVAVAAICMMTGCGNAKTDEVNTVVSSEQEMEEQGAEEQTTGEQQALMVTGEIKPVEVVFTDVKLGDTYEQIKEEYGECPESDIKVSMAGGNEYNYKCEYLEYKGTVSFGFDGGDKLVYIRWSCEAEDKDELMKLDENVTDELQKLYGDSSNTKADNVFRWDIDGGTIMITRMNATDAKLYYCTFYSSAYVDALQAETIKKEE